MEAADRETMRRAFASAEPGLLGGHWALGEPAMRTALGFLNGFLPKCAWQLVLAFSADLVWAQDPVPHASWMEFLFPGFVVLPEYVVTCFPNYDDREEIRVFTVPPCFCAGIRNRFSRWNDWIALGNLLAVRCGPLCAFFDLRRLAGCKRCQLASDVRGAEQTPWSRKEELVPAVFRRLEDIMEMGKEEQRSVGLLSCHANFRGRLAHLHLQDTLPPERCRLMVEELCKRALSPVGSAAQVNPDGARSSTREKSAKCSAAARSPADVALPDVVIAESTEPAEPVVQECEHAEPAAVPDALSDAAVAQELWATGVQRLIAGDEWVDLVKLTRFEKLVHDFLHKGRELDAVRAAAQEAGQSCRHHSGASIFLHPSDREGVLRALPESSLRPHHVLANRAFMPLIREALARLPCRKGVRIRSTSPVASLGHEAPEELHVDERTLPASIVERTLPASSSSGSLGGRGEGEPRTQLDFHGSPARPQPMACGRSTPSRNTWVHPEKLFVVERTFLCEEPRLRHEESVTQSDPAERRAANARRALPASSSGS